jgi:thioredoxin 1
VISTSDERFDDDVLRAATPVLVEFTAPWCKPCKAIEPFLAELEREHDGRLQVVQLDIEDHMRTPARYGVLSLPTVMVFAGGEVVETIDGAQPRRRYAAAVSRVLDS